ncbi:30S ribosomal protein S2 [archaeon]|nr:30S ribosomal protein S2 [archaeon]
MTENITKKEDDLLVPIETYLKAGIHIGSQYKTGNMKPYIYKTRQDGLHVLDIQNVDSRLRQAANFLANYEPNNILVIAGRIYARKPARQFAGNIGAMLSVKRFVPGTLTNPKNPNFVEPDLVMVSDPGVDKQAIIEAVKIKVPVIALCDTNNLLTNVDICVPINNKGKKALALAYWLLAREVMLKRETIKKRSEFKPVIEDFEA